MGSRPPAATTRSRNSFRSTSRRAYRASRSSISARGTASSRSSANVAAPNGSWHSTRRFGTVPTIGKRGFELARRVLGSKVEDVELDVLDISPERVGVFDLVLFLGVLYHMPHPLLALERVASVVGKQLILETHVDMNEHDRPVLAFYPEDECADDGSNWFGPNRAAVEAMLRVVGFRKVELMSSTPVLYKDSWRRQEPVRPHGVPCLEVIGGPRSGRRCGAFTSPPAAFSD